MSDNVLHAAYGAGNDGWVPFNLRPSPSEANFPALLAAVERNRAVEVRRLLELPPERGVNLAAHGSQALHMAVEHGHTEIVRLLLKLPAERGVHVAHLDAALHAAAHHGHAEVLRLLLRQLPARDFARTAFAATRMRGACVDPEVVQAVVDVANERSVDVVRLVHKLLCEAAKHGRVGVVRVLLLALWMRPPTLRRGVPSDVGARALTRAARHGHVGVARVLLELGWKRGVHPGADHNEALVVSATRGHAEFVRWLLALPPKYGVDPATRDNAALVAAVHHGHMEIVWLLLQLPAERGVDAAASDNAALVTAARRADADVTRLLLELPPQRGVRAAARNNAAVRLAAEAAMSRPVSLRTVRLLAELPAHHGVDVTADGCSAFINLVRAVDPQTWLGPAAARMLRYLTLEAPGGERSLDNEAVAEALLARRAAHPVLALLAEVMRRRRLWRRRRTLLLLRRLSDHGRATSLSVMDRRGAHRVGGMGNAEAGDVARPRRRQRRE